jgi:AsmA protein
MKLRNIIIFVALLVFAVPLIAAGFFVLAFNPSAYAPQIEAAAAKATGRALTLQGPLRVAFTPSPVIEADNVILANPAGFPDSNFLTLQELKAKIRLLPLLSHRIDIFDLVLESPRVTLESNAGGQSDWDFSSPSPLSPQNSSPPAPVSGGKPYKITLEAVTIQNGQILFKTAAGATTTLTIQNLAGNADSPASPLNLTATAAYNNIPFTLTGELGPVERFSGIGSGPWPVKLDFSATGATATLAGSIDDPSHFAGYRFAFNASIPNLAALQPWAGGAIVPPIQNLTATANLADQGSALPAITDAALTAGAADLSGYRKTLTLTSLSLKMPSLQAPVSVNLAGTFQNAPLTLSGTLGAPAALINPALLPPQQANPQTPMFPVNLTAAAAGANFAVTGGIATPKTFSGAALAVTATTPDLSQLSALAGTPLPAFKNLSLQTTITDPGGLGLQKSIGFTGLSLTMDNAAFGGDASLYFSPPRLDAALKGQNINLDAILAALPSPPATPANTPPPAMAGDITQSKLQLPIKLLQTASADVSLAAQNIVFNNTTYTAPQVHAVLSNGVLTINPLTAILPGGSISTTATIDATKTPAAETLAITAPALALGPFLKAIDLPDDAQGTLQAGLNATGAGDTPHDFFTTISGQLGLASVNGILDGTVLDALFGAVLNTVHLPDTLAGDQGPVPMRCFALRVDAQNGIGTVRALTLDSSRVTVQGGGTISFGDEYLDLILRPDLTVAGASLGLPVEISGPFENPRFGVAPLSVLQQAGKSALGLPVAAAATAASDANAVTGSLLGNFVGRLGLSGTTPGKAIAKALARPDVCPAALALGRLGAPGPAAESESAMAKSTKSGSGGPQNLLNALFGK